MRKITAHRKNNTLRSLEGENTNMDPLNEHSLFSLKLESVMEKITKMFDNQEHCDVTFNIQGHYLEAHKLVLIAQQFHLFVEHKDEAVINVKDIDYETFHSIIRYFYAERIDINTKNIFKLMHAAQVLHEARLADLCSSFLMRRACADNFVHLANASVEFKNTTLQRQLSTLFGTSMKSIIHDVKFKYLSPEGIKLLIGVPIFSSDCTDLQFFVMLRRWARAECERQNGGIASGQDIRNIFGEYFRKLRVPFMHSEDVARLVIGKQILTKEEEISLLHFLSLPAYLRMNEAQENFPFENKPLSKTLSDISEGARHIKVYNGNCSLCKAALDGCYGGEMIHCGKCDFDICMRCVNAPQHQDHQKFGCIKTVYGIPEDCCSSCGWPVKPSLFFHQYNSQTDELSSTAANKGDSTARTIKTASRAVYPGTPNTRSGGTHEKQTNTAFGGFKICTTSSGGGGLFGGTQSTSSGGGGLFGGTSSTSSGGGGLFGGTQSTSSGGGGLFGGTSSTSSGGGGLFGGTSSTSSCGGGPFGGTSSGGFTPVFDKSSKSGGSGAVVGNACTPPVIRGPDSAEFYSSEEKQERKTGETNLCKNCKCPLKGEKSW